MSAPPGPHERASAVAANVARIAPLLGGAVPELAIVLGTGLGAVVDHIDVDGGGEAGREHRSIAYAELKGFPSGGVTGHARRLTVVRRGGRSALVLEGRGHYYEAGDPTVMRVPLETLAALGIGRLLLTNAAGSLKPEMPPGSLMLIADHINLTGINPMVGEEGDGRFVNLVDAYSPVLRARLAELAAARGIPLPAGVYMWFAGPIFETPAEIRAARLLGADAVGMSTVPEVVIARRLGLEVAAISVITNLAAGMAAGGPTHEETKATAPLGAARLAELVAGLIDG